MPFAKITGDADLKSLVDRLYGLKGKGSQAATRQAAEELLAANPGLADIKSLPPGTRIRIPDTAPPLQPGQDAGAPLQLSAPELQRVTATLDAMQAAMTAIEDNMASRLQTALNAIQSAKIPQDFSALAKRQSFIQEEELPDPKSMVAAAKEAISAVRAASESRRQSMADLRGMLPVNNG
jgi:phage tail protein X